MTTITSTAPQQYISEYPPDALFDPTYRRFLADFYAQSDRPGDHDAYANYFTDDATLVMALKKAVGRREILALREGMWEHVASRSHRPVKVFPFGSGMGVDEVMVYGVVAYELKTGERREVDWAARANLTKDAENVRMRFYQVFLDTGASK